MVMAVPPLIMVVGDMVAITIPGVPTVIMEDIIHTMAVHTGPVIIMGIIMATTTSTMVMQPLIATVIWITDILMATHLPPTHPMEDQKAPPIMIRDTEVGLPIPRQPALPPDRMLP